MPTFTVGFTSYYYPSSSEGKVCGNHTTLHRGPLANPEKLENVQKD